MKKSDHLGGGWDKFNPDAYVSANYTHMLEADATICKLLAEVYGEVFDTGNRFLRVLDVGTGPNLYPLLATLPIAASIDCGDFSATNNAYLGEQLQSPDSHWEIFMRELQKHHSSYDNLPWRELLAEKVNLYQVDIYDLPPNTYDVVSSFFVAESITDVRGNFSTEAFNAHSFTHAIHSLVSATAPGGTLVLSLMSESTGYDTAGVSFPAVYIKEIDVRTALLAAGCTNIEIHQVNESVRDGHSGMLFCTAKKPKVKFNSQKSKRSTTSIEILHLDIRECIEDNISEHLFSIKKTIDPALLATSTLVVLIDDYSLSGRHNKIKKMSAAAAETIINTAQKEGIYIDAIAFESEMLEPANQLAEMLKITEKSDAGIIEIPSPNKGDDIEITLWKQTSKQRKYTCAMMAAAWQLCRLGVIEFSPTHLSTRPFRTKTAFTALQADYITVEADVMRIIAQIQPASLARSCTEQLGWFLLPLGAKKTKIGRKKIAPQQLMSPNKMAEKENIAPLDTADFFKHDHANTTVATALNEFFKDVTGDVIDIGTGYNIYTLIAASRAHSITSWDRSQTACNYVEKQIQSPDNSWSDFAKSVNAPEQWKEHLKTKTRVIHGDDTKLPPSTFDAATMLFIAEDANPTWENFATTISNVVKSLRPNGKIFIACTANPTAHNKANTSTSEITLVDIRAALVAAGTTNITIFEQGKQESTQNETYSGLFLAQGTLPVTPITDTH